MVFDVPDGVVEDCAEGLWAAFGVEAGAFEGGGREGGKPLGGPLAEGVDGGDEGGDGEVGAGFGGAVEAGVDEGFFVPGGEDGAVLGGDFAEAVDEDEFGVGEVAQEDAAGPAAQARVGAEGGVELGVIEPQDAAVEVLDADLGADDEGGEREGPDFVELDAVGAAAGDVDGVDGGHQRG